jgi:hypothetical protein
MVFAVTSPTAKLNPFGPKIHSPKLQTHNFCVQFFDTRFLLSGVPMLTLPNVNAAKPFGSGV